MDVSKLWSARRSREVFEYNQARRTALRDSLMVVLLAALVAAVWEYPGAMVALCALGIYAIIAVGEVVFAYRALQTLKRRWLDVPDGDPPNHDPGGEP